MDGRWRHHGPAPASRRIAASLLLASLLASTGDALAERRPHAPAESVTSILVEVPVQVLRDGEAVRGLTRDDFQLWDEGRLQRIASVDFYDYTSRAAQGRTGPDPSIPAAARRHVLLLFDLTFSSVHSLNRARHAAVQVVRVATHPDDLVGVATYSDTRGAQLVLSFTTDRGQAVAAIDAVGASQPQGRFVDALGLLAGPPATTEGRGGEAEIEIREIMRLSQDLERRASERRQVDNFAAGFTVLAEALRSVSGRKHVVLLSEGFDNEAIAASGDWVETTRMNQAHEQGEFWKIDSQARYGDSVRRAALERMTDALQRADCVVHSVDLQGADLSESIEDGDFSARVGGNQGLSMLASETGGRYTGNSSDVGAAMTRILDDLGATYVLGFRPAAIEPDGSYHKLKVRLAKGMEKARLIHRPGYFAPEPGRPRSAAERRLELTELLLEGGDRGSIPVSVIAIPFPRTEGTAFVPLFIEIDGPALAAGRVSGAVSTRILVYAFDAAGRVRDLFSQEVGLDLARVVPRLDHRGLKFFGSLRLAPGPHVVRVMVVESGTDRVQVRSVGLDVPGPTESAFRLLPPMVPDPQGEWVLARRPPEDTAAPAEPYPFQFADRPFVPAATPVVPSTGSLGLIVMTRNGAPQPPTLRVRILDADGRLLVEPRLATPQVGATADPELTGLSTELRTEGLHGGPCSLEVTLTGENGDSASATIPCIVAGAGAG